MEIKLNYDNLIIEDEKYGRHYYGGNQEWYHTFLKRMTGCGPTTASTIIMYEKRKMNNYNYSQKEFVKLMDEVWKYITPRTMGLYKVQMYQEGMDRYIR